MEQRHRPLIKKDGSFNIKKLGLSPSWFKDFYYHALKMSWPLFILFLLAAYFVLNLLFAVMYYACGPDALQGTGHQFWQTFLFSVHTSSTIGYGNILPMSLAANLIVVLQASISLLFVALITGLIFSKFSKPTARVLFSNQLLLHTLNNKKVLLFRVANARANQIVDASVNVVMLRDEHTAEGQYYKKMSDLKLERSTSPVFALSWTVMHTIDATSPLYGLSQADFEKQRIDFVISFTGIDDTFAQLIHAKKSYLFDDVVWDRYFEDVLEIQANGTIHVDFSKFHSLKVGE